MKYYPLIILILLGSCNLIKNNAELKKKSLSNVRKTNVLVLGKNKQIKIDTSSLYSMNSIKGTWIETGIWDKFDNGWNGIKPLDFYDEYTFTKSKKFIHKEIKSDSTVSWKMRGEYEISKDKKYINLYFNDNNDTSFAIGDTMHLLSLRIFYLDDSILKVQVHETPLSIQNLEIMELKRKD